MRKFIVCATGALVASLSLASSPALADRDCGPYRGNRWCGEREFHGPVYYAPRPTYYSPYYVPHRVYYAPPPVYYAPPPAYYAPPPAYYAPPAAGFSVNLPGVAIGLTVPLH